MTDLFGYKNEDRSGERGFSAKKVRESKAKAFSEIKRYLDVEDVDGQFEKQDTALLFSLDIFRNFW